MQTKTKTRTDSAEIPDPARCPRCGCDDIFIDGPWADCVMCEAHGVWTGEDWRWTSRQAAASAR